MKTEKVSYVFYVDMPKCRRYIANPTNSMSPGLYLSESMADAIRHTYFKEALKKYLKLKMKPGWILGYVKITEAYEFREVKL